MNGEFDGNSHGGDWNGHQGRPEGTPPEGGPDGNWGEHHGGMHNPPEWNNGERGFESNENNRVKQKRRNK